MDVSALMNTVGLVYDVLGAVLLFKFGLPEQVSRSGSSCLLDESTDEQEIEKGKLYDYWGRIALALLIAGFVVQAISNYV